MNVVLLRLLDLAVVFIRFRERVEGLEILDGHTRTVVRALEVGLLRRWVVCWVDVGCAGCATWLRIKWLLVRDRSWAAAGEQLLVGSSKQAGRRGGECGRCTPPPSMR